MKQFDFVGPSVVILVNHVDCLIGLELGDSPRVTHHRKHIVEEVGEFVNFKGVASISVIVIKYLVDVLLQHRVWNAHSRNRPIIYQNQETLIRPVIDHCSCPASPQPSKNIKIQGPKQCNIVAKMHAYKFIIISELLEEAPRSVMQNQYSFLFKYIIIGDASVGKSCILMQFLENKFKIDSETTVGVEFGSKIIEVGSEKLKLQIWDTAGQETFKSITRSYYRGSIGAVLVYDTTNRQSFSNLSKWVEETKNYANEKLSVILVGNKIDLDHKRVISTNEGREFAQKNKMLFIQCSAKNDTSKIFQDLASEILRKVQKKQIDPRNQTLGIKIGTFRSGKLLDETRGSYCC